MSQQESKNKTVETVLEKSGLFRNVPRTIKAAVKRRLKLLEDDRQGFDQEALINRPRMKRLYALLHVPPSGYAQSCLFGEAPESSSVSAVAQLVRLKTCQDKAADFVRQHQLPYLVTESALGRISEPVALALVETLETTELLSRLRLLTKRGLIKGAVRVALLKRLKALKDKPLDGLNYRRAESIARLAGLDSELAGALFEVVEKDPEGKALTGSTGLLIDMSLSMSEVHLTTSLASKVAALVDHALNPDDDLHCAVFSSRVETFQLERGSDQAAWRQRLEAVRKSLESSPGTSLGMAASSLLQQHPKLERLIVVTDGYENRSPRLHHALNDQRLLQGILPGLCLVVSPQGGRQLTMDMSHHQIPCETFLTQKNLLGFEALLGTLSRLGVKDDFLDISATKLPGE